MKVGPVGSQFHLHLQQGSTGSLTGSSTDCGGIFGTHVIHSTVAGSVTVSSHVTLVLLTAFGPADTASKTMTGRYTDGKIMLSGPPSPNPNAGQGFQDTTLTLTPITQGEFTQACAGQ